MQIDHAPLTILQLKQLPSVVGAVRLHNDLGHATLWQLHSALIGIHRHHPLLGSFSLRSPITAEIAVSSSPAFTAAISVFSAPGSIAAVWRDNLPEKMRQSG